jgi:prefoldin alpha subunit
MKEEEKLRDVLAQIESYRGLSRLLQQQIAELTAVRAEFSMTLNFLMEMEKIKDGDQILTPVGSGSFIKTKIDSTNVVLVSVGANVVVEKTPNEAREILERRIKEIDETLKTLRENLEKVDERLRSLTPEAERLMRREQRGT